MKEEDKLKHRCGTDTGFRVPDGYFDHVFSEIDAKLPPHPGLQAPPALSRWQRLKPYVYLAAMFGGIWCTMKMVSMVSDTASEQVSLDNPPELIAQAMSSPEIVSQVCSSPSVMVIDDEAGTYEAEACVSADMADIGTETVQETDMAEEEDYSGFVSVSDIDLGQLQAALYADDKTEDDYYYYI